MAARPRIRKRANWPDNLHEPREGYYTWRDPRDGKTHVLGRMPLAQAMHEALEANAVVAAGKVHRTLAERLSEPSKTIGDLLDKMPTAGVKKSTTEGRKYRDRVIREKLGTIECKALTTKHIAEMLEQLEAAGKMQWSVLIRSRLKAICRRGKALGWMTDNPVQDTERAKVTVKRRRLTLAEFNAVRAKASEVAPWLENAMLLALVSGQDRSTIARWERTFVVDGAAVLTRGKTGVRIAIPLELRMDAIGLSLADVIARCRATGVVSKYLIHHVKQKGPTQVGAYVKLGTISAAFSEARTLAEIPPEGAPTFHEIRSLSKRLYMEQGGVDTKALLGHMSDVTADLYANSRGLEPIKVKINGA